MEGNALIMMSKSIAHKDVPRALEFAKRAKDSADHLVNRRLHIRSSIQLGSVLLKEPLKNTADARELLVDAKKHLRTSDLDYLRDEVDEFEMEVEGIKTGEERVAQVTIGQVFTRSLDENLQEVEREIVSRVYKLLGTTLQTSKALNISRNRVKRILTTESKKSLINENDHE